jgi:bacterioferritin-associated ferredoxin
MGAADTMRTGDVYRALGCAPRCGRCASAIAEMLVEAKGRACKRDCRPGLCACVVDDERRAA